MLEHKRKRWQATTEDDAGNNIGPRNIAEDVVDYTQGLHSAAFELA